VTVDARQDGAHVNNLELTLAVFSPRLARAAHPIPQTAPGRYELTIEASPQPRLAIVQLDRHLLDRRALPGRYPREFDAIGNNMETLVELAKRTGGEVIEPGRTSPIDFPRPPDRVALGEWFAAAGAAFVAAGLVRWRLA
jgi:hypothetical protein